MRKRKQAKHFAFGPFLLDPAERTLVRDGVPVALPPKTFETLLALVRRSGHVVEKDELMKVVWPDTFVEEGNLTVNVSLLRKVLGEAEGGKPYIETVPRRGYRFNADVRELQNGGADLLVRRSTRTRVLVEEEEEGCAEAEVGPAPAPRTAGAVPGGRGRFARKPGRVALIVLSLLAGALGTFLYLRTPRGPETPAPAAAIKSIAVLPFKPLVAADQDENYLGVGLADALITRLANVRQIGVRPTSAVLRFDTPQQDSLAAARALGVDAVLEGSYQREGERVRVTVQLVGARDGAQLWSGKFDEEFKDIFSVQDSISREVARALAANLSEAEQRLLAKRPTASTEAYQFYLKGRYFWNKRGDWVKKAAEFFERAVAEDPGFALAYVGLADSYSMCCGWPEAEAAGRRALELDPTLAEAHAFLGFLRMFRHWDWEGSEQAFRHSIELNPNYATAHQWYATNLMLRRRFGEARQELGRALEIDPLSLPINADLCEVLHYERRYDEAVWQCEKTLEMDPAFVNAHIHLSRIYMQKKMYKGAVDSYVRSGGATPAAEAEGHPLAKTFAESGIRGVLQARIEYLSGLPNDSDNRAYGLAYHYALAGENEWAIRFLRQSYERHDFMLPFANAEPAFDDIRTDPRFLDLMRRMGLAP